MLSRSRNSRGRPVNASAAFINPCQPIVAKQPPNGPGWAHELNHDGCRLQFLSHDAPYPSGKSKAWIEVKNPKAPAATRATDGAF